MGNDTDRFTTYLHCKGAEIINLTSCEEEVYRQEWFTRVVPANMRQKAIASHCFDEGIYNGYLWHVFSYEILDSLKGTEAKSAFNNISKQEAVLLVKLVDIASCRIRNISYITAGCFDFLDDIILTDSNFEWVYVKTHEPTCGPYFYNTPGK